MPSFVVAPDARTIYVTWHSPPPAPAGLAQSTAPSQILFSKSTDAGGTWSTPAAVDATPGQRFLPTIAVSPQGTIEVSYYDFDSGVAGDGALSTDLWFTLPMMEARAGGATACRARSTTAMRLPASYACGTRRWPASREDYCPRSRSPTRRRRRRGPPTSATRV